MTPCAIITPPSVAMGPTAALTRELMAESSSLSGIGAAEDERATNANGTWPLRGSGAGMTQLSVIEGCEDMACSRVAGEEVSMVLLLLRSPWMTYQCLTCGQQR